VRKQYKISIDLRHEFSDKLLNVQITLFPVARYNIISTVLNVKLSSIDTSSASVLVCVQLNKMGYFCIRSGRDY
jgi:hypothetical protein